MSLPELDLRVLDWINHHRIPGFDNTLRFISNTTGAIAIIIALIIIVYGILKKTPYLKYRKYQAAVAYTVNAMLINVIKYAVNRRRPFEIDSHIEKLTGGGSPSFPSGHTGDAVVIALSFSFLFPKKIFINIIIWIWAVLVAYSRMALGAHFPADVLGAAAISTILALACKKLFDQISERKSLLKK